MAPVSGQGGRKAAEAAYRGPAWAAGVAVRVQRDLAELATANGHSPAGKATEQLLIEAADAVALPAGLRQWWKGSRQHLALMRMHEAEAQLAMYLTGDKLRAHARDLLAFADGVLPPEDPRLVTVAGQLAGRRADHVIPTEPLSPVAVAHLARAVHDVEDERLAQSRAFRNRLIRLIGLSVAALGGLVGAFAVNAIPVRPLGEASSNVRVGLLVGLFGAIGAMIVGVPPLARAGGTWNPFSLPYYQMLLKVALGPLFAVVGVLLLQAGLIPNVSVPMPLADLLVWALVFGAAQQTVTSAVDSRVSGLVASAPSVVPVVPDRNTRSAA